MTLPYTHVLEQREAEGGDLIGPRGTQAQLLLLANKASQSLVLYIRLHSLMAVASHHVPNLTQISLAVNHNLGTYSEMYLQFT